MAKKARKANKNTHKPPKRRRYYIFPYVVMALLIIGIPLTIYQLYVSNVNRTIGNLTEAIQTEDMDYLNENTDRLPVILDVLKKSYADDETKQNEFYTNNFKNLEIRVDDTSNKTKGKEVKLTVSNVNYIDVYDKIPDSESDDKVHADYMAALGDSNQEKNTREATIFLERHFSGYKIYESRDFISALLGGALEYVENESADSDKATSADPMEDAINNEDN